MVFSCDVIIFIFNTGTRSSKQYSFLSIFTETFRANFKNICCVLLDTWCFEQQCSVRSEPSKVLQNQVIAERNTSQRTDKIIQSHTQWKLYPILHTNMLCVNKTFLKTFHSDLIRSISSQKIYPWTSRWYVSLYFSPADVLWWQRDI